MLNRATAFVPRPCAIFSIFQVFSPPAIVIPLEHNYRSTQPILDAATAVMARASERFAKTLTSSKPSDELPYLITVEDETAQAVFIAGQVLEQREAGIELRHQAVLFRAAHHSARLEIELACRNIPFVKYGGLKFIEAAHVKDLLAILRWAENPRDTVAGFRTLQLLPGTGPAGAKKAALYLTEHRFDLGKLADFVPPAAAALAWPEFCRLLRDLQNGAIAWAGQIGAVRAWYQPHLERLYDYPTARAGDLEANSSRKSNSRAAPQWVDSTGIAVERLFWARTGNNRAKTQHFRHFRMSISRLSIAHARARERQVFRARAESPNARRRDKRADRPFAKIKELFTKIMRLS